LLNWSWALLSPFASFRVCRPSHSLLRSAVHLFFLLVLPVTARSSGCSCLPLALVYVVSVLCFYSPAHCHTFLSAPVFACFCVLTAHLRYLLSHPPNGTLLNNSFSLPFFYHYIASPSVALHLSFEVWLPFVFGPPGFAATFPFRFSSLAFCVFSLLFSVRSLWFFACCLFSSFLFFVVYSSCLPYSLQIALRLSPGFPLYVPLTRCLYLALPPSRLCFLLVFIILFFLWGASVFLFSPAGPALSAFSFRLFHPLPPLCLPGGLRALSGSSFRLFVFHSRLGLPPSFLLALFFSDHLAASLWLYIHVYSPFDLVLAFLSFLTVVFLVPSS